MAAISYHDTVNVLQGVPFAGRGPFARPEWFALLERSGERPLVALARDGAEALALPLVRGDRGLEGLSNWYAFTWTELATGDAPREALLARLARDLPAHASRVTLGKLPDEDGSATRLERAFREAGWIVVREPCDTNHVLPVAGRSYAEYLAGRPGPLRTTLKRKAKKVEVEVLTSFSGETWAAYERVVAAGQSPVAGSESLDDEAVLLEELYLGLRTREGIEGDRLPQETRDAWLSAGWASVSNGRFRLSPDGWLRLDALVAAV